jgi:hypothetical protein
MNFVTHKDMTDRQIIDLTNMTHLQGSTRVTYQRLVEIFGDPEPGGDKTDVEWTILFDDGTVATIYNWKDGRNYCGANGLDPEDIQSWHIGGHEFKAYLLVSDTINAFLETQVTTILKKFGPIHKLYS